MKPKKCKECKKMFQPTRLIQPVCENFECMVAYANKSIFNNRKKEKKSFEKWKRDTKERLKTYKDYAKDLQKLVNTFVRFRDTGKKCISCDRTLQNKFDAGHYFSAGGNPELRFSEYNIHGQCVYCNQHLHGNLIEYSSRLPERIGEAEFEKLKAMKDVERKFTVFELKELIIKYKHKIKQIKNEKI